MDKSTTVEKLARKLGDFSIDALIKKLNLAGVNVSKFTDPVTLEQEKMIMQLLQGPNQISLRRRSTVSQIKVKNASGGNTTVSVVRKNRRVYVKSGDLLNNPQESQSSTQLSPDNVAKESIKAESKEVGVIEDTLKDSGSVNQLITVLSETDPNQAKGLKVDEKTVKSSATGDSSLDQDKNKGNKSKKDKKNKDLETTEEEDLKVKKIKAKSTKNKDKNTSHNKLNLNLLSKVATEDLDDLDFNSGKKLLTRKVSKNGIKSLNINKNLHAFEKPTTPIKYQVELPVKITVNDLAQKMSIKSKDLIKEMMKMGIMANINQLLDQETASLIVEEMGHTVIMANPKQLEDSISIEYTSPLEHRSPIVTVMGHVDHGKTSLLDYIRSTRVTAKEAGGITQHIGAYQVPTRNHGMITFLDTPGHSAFTAMRARGANCTDIIVLVVAADDGVMPQTVEAIQHAKAGEVPIIVAINKIDKVEADPERVMSDLSNHGIMPEEWGGNHIFVKISAKTGEGIDNLLEAIALQAEVLELKAPYFGPAQGVILESSLDKTRGGIVATLLIQSGTLHQGDTILAGSEYGKIKKLCNDQGISIEQAVPSCPVEILGLNSAPLAGDKFQVVFDERKAKEVASMRQNVKREELLLQQHANKFEGFIDRMHQAGQVKKINIVLKADVQGSVEAIADALNKLSNEQVKVNIIGKAVGAFNESDVNLAIASNAFLLGFNVRAEVLAKALGKTQGKEFNYYSVIYDLINAVKAVIEGSIVVPTKEIIVGMAEVREVFRSSKFGTVAGCLVKEGLIKKGNPVRVLRDNVVIYSGELDSLRRFKENLNEVRQGFECGIGVKNYNDIKAGDQIEVFEVVPTIKAKTYKVATELKK